MPGGVLCGEGIRFGGAVVQEFLGRREGWGEERGSMVIQTTQEELQ